MGSSEMNILEKIEEYLAEQPEPKRSEMRDLHGRILKISPNCRLWYLNGKDSNDKIVSNPNIGYGDQIINCANGNSKEFYRIGMSSNKSGISIYIIGLNDRKYLPKTYHDKIGDATVTGYCIKFKNAKNINMSVLEEIIRFGFDYQDKTG